jgi:hypothetical protein
MCVTEYEKVCPVCNYRGYGCSYRWGQCPSCGSGCPKGGGCKPHTVMGAIQSQWRRGRYYRQNDALFRSAEIDLSSVPERVTPVPNELRDPLWSWSLG